MDNATDKITINQSLLLVEDDTRLATLVANYIRKHGFHVSVEAQGDIAVKRIIDEQPALVVLDILLPGLDGLEVCRQARVGYSGPILMLTALDEDVDQIVGLEIGADDYVTKPVEPRVLLARIRALLRRAMTANTNSAEDKQITLADGVICIDAGARELRCDGQVVKMTTSEFDLLWLLASHAGTVFSRDDLYQTLNGFCYDGVDRAMDIRVSKLRKLLNDDPDDPKMIKTVRGKGYLFAAGL